MNCYLNIWNPRSQTVPSFFLCDYCRGPFTLYSRRLSSNGVGQGEQSRVSNPLVDGRWTCGSLDYLLRQENRRTCFLLRQENMRTCFFRQENMRTRGRVKAWLSKTRTWGLVGLCPTLDACSIRTFPSNFCRDTWILLRLRVRQVLGKALARVADACPWTLARAKVAHIRCLFRGVA